jgi:hypothetical protein
LKAENSNVVRLDLRTLVDAGFGLLSGPCFRVSDANCQHLHCLASLEAQRLQKRDHDRDSQHRERNQPSMKKMCSPAIGLKRSSHDITSRTIKEKRFSYL